MDDSYAVELQDIVKRFANITAVSHVSLKIRDGEFFSLLGPSGCGKTTTLRMIAGFEIPTSGQIYIGGEAQGYLPAYQRPVNTVFQQYALFPHMTVAQNVAFGLQMKKVDNNEIKQRVNEALELVHLDGMSSRRPKQLSGGQQQRVALARALVNHPKVLLLDEPLGALDLKLRKAMQFELKALQHRVGITFIYITHDQEEALTMSDRIGVMDQGQLLQVGSAQEVYEAPQSRFVSDFIGETNYLDGHLAHLDGEHAEIVIDPEMRIRSYIIPGLHEGQQVSVAFRPEKIRLNQPEQQGFNRLAGTVTNIVYIGSVTDYHVLLPGNNSVVVRRQNLEVPVSSGDNQSVQIGAQATISWAIDASKAFSG